MEDPAWKAGPLQLGDWLTYNPAYGEKLAQKTEVWMTYDKDFLYFAFRCLDPEPEKIKTSISRRDTQWNDDWVGLSLDSMGNGQSSYDMFLNPNGIQGDILTSSTGGEDIAPDWVWDSAGKLTKDGYVVEMRLPLKSIRFKSGAEVKMGVLFWRRVSRLGQSASWPDLPPGQFVFGRHATAVLRDLKQPLTLEVIPNATYSLSQTRANPDGWNDADSRPDAGLTVKYGLTSSVTLDGTINPDFSQVESDAFQVEVNQRFPIFFNEKRPFFMEGMGTFELAGAGGDGNMRTAVHTRRIVDPIFGTKLSGTVGKFTFGTLSAADQDPGRLPSGHPDGGRDKFFNVARVLYTLSTKGSYAGGLVTDTEFADGHNRVAAGDVLFRIGEHQQLSSTFMGSATMGSATRSADGARRSGMAGQVYYAYSSKRYVFVSQAEHYDRDFQMDTAFYNRTGITTGWGFATVNFYPDQKKYSWLKRVSPFVFSTGGRDRIQRGNEIFALAGLRFSLTRQGFVNIDAGGGQEPFAGKVFPRRTVRVFANAQITKWLNFSTQLQRGRSVFYDAVDPFGGRSGFQRLDLTVQPNAKINQRTGYNYVTFDRSSDGKRIYSIHIINSRTTYQLDKHFFVRAILQYDSSRHRILTDLLGSFELLPGTVTYVGYGSLIEKREWDGTGWLNGVGDYIATRRGFFFKASYLHRF
ncbi:MAG: DUF5916 domain-containing protein [Acidobacteriota bacterium]